MLLSAGIPAYTISFKGRTVIDTSAIGFELRDQPDIHQKMSVKHSERRSFQETWVMPWGEQRFVKNHYHELKIILKELLKPEREMHIFFRVYDDGLGFRFEFPEQPGWPGSGDNG